MTGTAGDPNGDGGNWYLTLESMDWNLKSLKTIGSILLPPAAVMDGQYTITQAYDPTAMQYNGETWVAFECVAGGTTNSCVGPLTSSYQVDLSRVSIPVLGKSAVSNDYYMSASVPKLLNYDGKIYLYWTAVKIDKYANENGHPKFLELNVRGVELAVDASGRFFAAASAAPIGSDDPSTVEVFGVDPNDTRSNVTADASQAIEIDGSIYMVTVLGGTGCTAPLDGVEGCYRFGVSRSQEPLKYHAFNETKLDESLLPGNPTEYVHIVTNSSGDHIFIGHMFANPYPKAIDQPAGIVTFPLPQSPFFLFQSTPVPANSAPVIVPPTLTPAASPPAFDQAAAQAQLTQAYHDILGRDPDATGLAYWVGQMAAGMILQDARTAIANSYEGQIRQAYVTYLGRVPDGAGLSYWITLANSGTSIATVVADIASSPEAQIRQAYLTYLGREPDAAGLAAWINLANSGTGMADVIAGIANSPEALARR